MTAVAPPILPDRYRVASTLGQGGMATVYLATDTTAHAQVAIKVPHRHLTENPLVVARLRREMAACRRIRHPNVVAVFDILETPACVALVLEYVPGGDLRGWFLERGRIPVPEVVEIARQTLAGLAAAHEQGVVHRDLKPHNLLRAEDGTIKISDFGIARVDELAALTAHSMILGSPAYMPPEVLGGEASDVRSDLYSLGVTLYELLTGQLPVRGDTLRTLVEAHRLPVPDPRHVAPEIPEPLARLVMKALAKDPDQRFASAEEMTAALGGGALVVVETPPPACARCGAWLLPDVPDCVECGHAPIRTLARAGERALARGRGEHRVIVRRRVGRRLSMEQKARIVEEVGKLGGRFALELATLERRLSDPQVVLASGLEGEDARRLCAALEAGGIDARVTAGGAGPLVSAIVRSPAALQPTTWAMVVASSAFGYHPWGQSFLYMLLVCWPQGITSWELCFELIRGHANVLAILLPFVIAPDRKSVV